MSDGEVICLIAGVVIGVSIAWVMLELKIRRER